jgi:hypothetical protein
VAQVGHPNLCEGPESYAIFPKHIVLTTQILKKSQQESIIPIYRVRDELKEVSNLPKVTQLIRG